MSVLLEKVAGFETLKDGWNGRRSTATIPQALVRMIVGRDLDPTRLAPSAVGGVGVTRCAGERVASVECYNDGSVHAIFSADKSERKPTAFVLTGMAFDNSLV